MERIKVLTEKPQIHPKCRGTYDAYSGDFGCEYGSQLDCGECKYGAGRKDPEAKCNHEQ